MSLFLRETGDTVGSSTPPGHKTYTHLKYTCSESLSERGLSFNKEQKSKHQKEGFLMIELGIPAIEVEKGYSGGWRCGRPSGLHLECASATPDATLHALLVKSWPS